MKVPHTAFIFDLFLDRKIPSSYDPQVLNSLSHKFIKEPLIRQEFEDPFYLIKDIPQYLKVEKEEPTQYSCKKINQYQGFLIDFTGYETQEEYVKTQLSKRGRKKLLRSKEKLERNFNISYKVYFGEITRTTYDYLFERFYDLLKIRFEQMKIYNRYLIKWRDLYKLVFPMIQNKQASLFVIYHNKDAITITLNFHLGDIILSHIEAFDITFKRYSLGSISMMAHIDWCLKNNVKALDLTMGHTPFKSKWCNHVYTLEYHLFYLKSSKIQNLKAIIFGWILKSKQFLRDINVIGRFFMYDRFFYRKQTKRLQGYEWHQGINLARSN